MAVSQFLRCFISVFEFDSVVFLSCIYLNFLRFVFVFAYVFVGVFVLMCICV